MSCQLLFIRDSGKTCSEGLLEDHRRESEKDIESNLIARSLTGNGCLIYLWRTPKEESIKRVEPISLGCGLDNKINTIFK